MGEEGARSRVGRSARDWVEHLKKQNNEAGMSELSRDSCPVDALFELMFFYTLAFFSHPFQLSHSLFASVSVSLSSFPPSMHILRISVLHVLTPMHTCTCAQAVRVAALNGEPPPRHHPNVVGALNDDDEDAILRREAALAAEAEAQVRLEATAQEEVRNHRHALTYCFDRVCLGVS
jgi:hypothetical protein